MLNPVTILLFAAAAQATPGFDLEITTTDAIAGRPLLVTVSGLAPGDEIVMTWSPSGEGVGPLFGPGNTLQSDLADPVRVIRRSTAPPTGVAQMTLEVPAEAEPGPRGALQAWAMRAADSVKSLPLTVEVVLPDDDGDGYRADVDCDDLDDRAHPGASAWHTTPRFNGGFDFNCDGQEEQTTYADNYCSCSPGGVWPFSYYFCWTEYGFYAPIAACGVTVSRLTSCSGNITSNPCLGCTEHRSDTTQACR